LEWINETVRGRFRQKGTGSSTGCVGKGGVPGKSIIEIECIGYM